LKLSSPALPARAANPLAHLKHARGPVTSPSLPEPLNDRTRWEQDARPTIRARDGDEHAFLIQEADERHAIGIDGAGFLELTAGPMIALQHVNEVVGRQVPLPSLDGRAEVHFHAAPAISTLTPKQQLLAALVMPEDCFHGHELQVTGIDLPSGHEVGLNRL
jgi:hypothetical protein